MSARSLVHHPSKHVAAFPGGTRESNGIRWTSLLDGRWVPFSAARAASGRHQVTRLLAVVYADMAGYSRLFALDDAGTVARLRSVHKHRIRPATKKFQARRLQITGDSLLILFDTVGQAVECAVTIQSQLAIDDESVPDDRQMRFRMGVDLGDIIMDGVNFHSDGVIVASRLQAVCPPGAVCVSRAVHERGGARLGLPCQATGPLALKGVARPVEAFVLWPR
jgi:adenylate cyclase